MNKQLPERSHLEQLKTQAKDLLNEVRAGQAGALVRIGNEHRETFALHDAQRILAREYGFPSWPKLKLHVETRTEDDAEARLIEAALEGEEANVAAILQERPLLGRRSVYVAAALGDLEALQPWLTRQPDLAKTMGGPRNWEPILYLCFARCGAADDTRAGAANLLLAAGGNPNAFYVHRQWPEGRESALFGATGWNNFPAVAEVLLRAGADPNDGESCFHAAQFNHVACLEVLARFGANFDAADKTWKNTPLYFLLHMLHHDPRSTEGIRWLLTHGANPNRPSQEDTLNETALQMAVRMGWGQSMIELLLQHGADPRLPRRDGRTAYALAVRGGREDIVSLFRAHQVPDEASEVDRLLGACMREDATTAREWLRRNPRLVATIPEEDRRMVLDAAQAGKAKALSLMHEIGFDLTKVDDYGATPLHWAAWHGWADAVRALVEAGVPLDPVDSRFEGRPVGWCSEGSLHACNPRGDYAATMEALIAGGAKVPEKWRKVWKASEPVLEVLKRHGLIP